MGTVRLSRSADLLRRGRATGCAVVVFALGLLAASPALHGELHHGTPAPAGDACAVALFAGGVALAVPVFAPPPHSTDHHAPRVVVRAEILLDSPRYLHRPERGPPAS